MVVAHSAHQWFRKPGWPSKWWDDLQVGQALPIWWNISLGAIEPSWNYLEDFQVAGCLLPWNAMLQRWRSIHASAHGSQTPRRDQHSLWQQSFTLRVAVLYLRRWLGDDAFRKGWSLLWKTPIQHTIGHVTFRMLLGRSFRSWCRSMDCSLEP